MRQFFDEAFGFIDLARASRSGVLIHCHAGVSRSPTIAVAYLMKRYPVAMAEAYKFVKARRSIISPNLNFMGQLYEYEQGLREEDQVGNTKEPLTDEMLRVIGGGEGAPLSAAVSTPTINNNGFFFGSASSTGSSSAASSSSSASSSVQENGYKAPSHHHEQQQQQQPFSWSEQHHQQQSESEGSSSSGCSV